MLIKNPERCVRAPILRVPWWISHSLSLVHRLAEWLKHPTDLELQLAAKAERKRAARAAW